MTGLPIIPTSETDPMLSVTTGIPVSETILSPILPTLPSTDVLSLTDGISLPGASGTGITRDPTVVPTTSPALVDTSNVVSTGPASTNRDTTTADLLPTLNFPTQTATNATLAPPTPSGVSPTVTGTPTTGTGIPTTEDGPTTTLLSGPESTAGATNGSSIVTSGIDSPVSIGLTGISTGISATGGVSKVTSAQTTSATPTSDSSVGKEPDDKDEKPPVPNTSVTENNHPTPIPTQQTNTSAQPTEPSTQTSDTSTQPITSDATFGTYMSTPTDYVPGSTTEPLVAFPTGPPAGKDGEAPPPPLTKKQTAGIAIGGTTCLLIALVAALFLARRYHQNAANRKSLDNVYAREAPNGGNGDAEAGGPVPTMSGANGGYFAAAALGRPSSRRHTTDYSTLPQNSPGHPPVGFGTSSGPSSAQIPQNPFRDPAQGVATNATEVQNPFLDPVVPEPQPSPRGEYAQLAALAIKPYAQNPAASDYPPMSPYGSIISEDPFADDPFAHDNTDLLLNVDLGTETENSIVVLAPPPTPHSPFAERLAASPKLGSSCRYEPPAPCASHFPGRDSRCNSMIPGSHTPEGRYMPDHHLSMGPPPIAPLGHLTPAYSSSTPSLLSRNTPDSVVSSRNPITPEPIAAPERAASPPPVSKGWDEIMNEPVAIPAPLSMATTRKPLPQRGQPPLSGPGQPLVATPLIIKKKPVTGATLAVPPSPYGPVPSKAETMSDPLTVQRKRSGELLFADPHLIGRPF
ncbi:hypothetical protein K458DRAFT_383179 [Lentithecium fluviatile CBS 122367]|uniref:Uncharacterized protein n=1 Tax=Lentithecium fluviatile CBS 122367 TaxID=1168545 RepID=A0A6G1JIQ0_9PLEO|nr:hypothetical protein K458DRAFT_383179 [Lentithecium fluviatile CBS 122367]